MEQMIEAFGFLVQKVLPAQDEKERGEGELSATPPYPADYWACSSTMVVIKKSELRLPQGPRCCDILYLTSRICLSHSDQETPLSPSHSRMNVFQGLGARVHRGNLTSICSIRAFCSAASHFPSASSAALSAFFVLDDIASCRCKSWPYYYTTSCSTVLEVKQEGWALVPVGIIY